jgi:hypothetical protein
MAKQSETNAGLKNLSSFALLAVLAIISIVFMLGLGFFGSEYSGWPWLIVPVLSGMIAIPLIRKTKIERYYEAVGASHPEVKPIRRLDKQRIEEDTVFTFRMPVGMSKSQYEKYREGLEQYLDAKVEFRFEHNLIIKVTERLPDP